MKKEYLIIGIVAFVIALVLIYTFTRKKEEKIVEIDDILHLYVSYSNGYMANSSIRYSLDYDEKEDRYTVSIKPYLVDDDDVLKKEVTKEFADKLKEILTKYEVAKWDGFNKSDQNVLDGDSFSFSVRMKNDVNISASGYMMWPKNYGKVIGEFDTLFMNIYNEEKGITENE